VKLGNLASNWLCYEVSTIGMLSSVATKGLVAQALQSRMGCLLFWVHGKGGREFQGELKDSIHIGGNI
jgi:hypothetical protein